MSKLIWSFSSVLLCSMNISLSQRRCQNTINSDMKRYNANKTVQHETAAPETVGSLKSRGTLRYRSKRLTDLIVSAIYFNQQGNSVQCRSLLHAPGHGKTT